jgi:hypothetical protein
MYCPNCKSHAIEHKGVAKLMMDTNLGMYDYKLNAWECKDCHQVFYTDVRY